MTRKLRTMLIAVDETPSSITAIEQGLGKGDVVLNRIERPIRSTDSCAV